MYRASKTITHFYIATLLCFFLVYKSFLIHSFFQNLSLSYFLFNTIGFLMDKSKSNTHEIRPMDLFSRLIFLPNLFQGPIVKIENLNIHKKQSLIENINVGGPLFLWGLYRYYVISYFFNRTFYELYESNISGLYVLILGFLIFMDVYIKFSSAIDIVTGLSRCFGIHLPLNFHGRVYFSNTRMKFWSGWNLTVNGWFKNYLLLRFFGKKSTNTIKLMIIPTCLIIGLWHGFSFHFFLWGLFNGVLIFMESKIKLNYKLKKKYNLILVLNQLLINCLLFLLLFNDLKIFGTIFEKNHIEFAPHSLGYYLLFGVNVFITDLVEKSFKNKGFTHFFIPKSELFKYAFMLFILIQFYYVFITVSSSNTYYTFYDKF